MKFSYSIQKVSFYVDQFEEKGDVTLKKAIHVFQNFPFSEQLEEEGKREMTSCWPKIEFRSENGKLLSIWAEHKDGFYIHYSNGDKVSDIEISYDFEKNPDGMEVEDFIELFFKQEIEETLVLKEKETREDYLFDKDIPMEKSIQDPIQTYSFNETPSFYHLHWAIVWFVLTLFWFEANITKDGDLEWLILLMTFIWLPNFILHITYWSFSKGTQISIDAINKSIEIERNGFTKKFNRMDIQKCELHEARSSRAKAMGDYRYLLIELNDKSKIVVTNFVTEPENILEPLKLNYEVIGRTFVFLPKLK